MGLESRLSAVQEKQFGLIKALRAARSGVATARARLQMRIAELDEQERHARIQYEEAVAEDDPQAEALREWPERTHARIEELEAAVGELESAEEMVSERIRAAEEDLEKFRVLLPHLVARVTAARNTGVSREVFDTLNDALNYIELALDAAADEDPNGPLRHTSEHMQIAAPVYPKNASGQTYGSAAKATTPENEPDLILVVATNGKTGYVKRTDLEPKAAANPAQAVQMQKANAASSAVRPPITVFESDGETAIGEFAFTTGTNTTTQ